MAQRPLPAMPRRSPAVPAAWGRLVITGDITCLTRARVFAGRGKTTPLWLRLPDAAAPGLPPPPLALTLGTEDGAWTLPLRRLPVEFLRRPAQRAALEAAAAEGGAAPWALLAQHPEALHALLHAFADAAHPASWRAAPFFGATTHALEREGRILWCRWRLVPLQAGAEGEGMAPRALFDAIGRGAPARWRLSVQVMPEAEAREAPFDAFDATCAWPEARWPLIEVGVVLLEGRLDLLPAAPALAALPGLGPAPSAPRRHRAPPAEAGPFFRRLAEEERARLMDRLAAALRGQPRDVLRGLLAPLAAADAALGAGLTRRLWPGPVRVALG